MIADENENTIPASVCEVLDLGPIGLPWAKPIAPRSEETFDSLAAASKTTAASQIASNHLEVAVSSEAIRWNRPESSASWLKRRDRLVPEGGWTDLTSSTFSCDIGYPVSPAASRACCLL